MGFYELLDRIRERPALYLPRYSIFDFQAFYFGYMYAREIQQLDKTEEEETFNSFLESVRDICPVKTRHSWANLILFYSADERDALNNLFGMFEDFQKNNLRQRIEDSNL